MEQAKRRKNFIINWLMSSEHIINDANNQSPLPALRHGCEW